MSTEQEREAVSVILKKCERPVIIELGAYCGEDSEWLRAAVNDTHEINVMVEPDPRNVDLIRQYRAGVRTVLIEAAISDRTGVTPFFAGMDARSDGERSGSGSVRKPARHVELFPEITFLDSTVPCWSLDHLTYSLGIFGEIDFLWVDIQGAENLMVAGGQNALSRTRYLFIEAEQTELYRGQALREELLGMLPQFKVIGEFDYNLLLEAR